MAGPPLAARQPLPDHRRRGAARALPHERGPGRTLRRAPHPQRRPQGPPARLHHPHPAPHARRLPVHAQRARGDHRPHPGRGGGDLPRQGEVPAGEPRSSDPAGQPGGGGLGTHAPLRQQLHAAGGHQPALGHLPVPARLRVRPHRGAHAGQGAGDPHRRAQRRADRPDGVHRIDGRGPGGGLLRDLRAGPEPGAPGPATLGPRLQVLLLPLVAGPGLPHRPGRRGRRGGGRGLLRGPRGGARDRPRRRTAGVVRAQAEHPARRHAEGVPGDAGGGVPGGGGGGVLRPRARAGAGGGAYFRRALRPGASGQHVLGLGRGRRDGDLVPPAGGPGAPLHRLPRGVGRGPGALRAGPAGEGLLLRRALPAPRRGGAVAVDGAEPPGHPEGPRGDAGAGGAADGERGRRDRGGAQRALRVPVRRGPVRTGAQGAGGLPEGVGRAAWDVPGPPAARLVEPRADAFRCFAEGYRPGRGGALGPPARRRRPRPTPPSSGRRS